jgi:hypothetical protein
MTSSGTPADNITSQQRVPRCVQLPRLAARCSAAAEPSCRDLEVKLCQLRGFADAAAYVGVLEAAHL